MSTITDFDSLRAYRDGWCGKGSLAAPEQTFTNALSFVDLWNRKETEVTLEHNGTISFQWGDSYLEVGKTKFSMWNHLNFINGTFEARND